MTLSLLLAALAAGAAPEPALLCRVERPVLALATAGPERLLLLEDDRLSLWRVDAAEARKIAEVAAPAPVERIRHPTALFHAPSDGAWVLRSGWPHAILASVGGRAEPALSIVSTADALPWPGGRTGVRFRSGTSLIQGPLEGLGDGPFLALSPDGAAAVDGEGRLLLRDRAVAADAPRVGSALVRPWPEILVASASTPPDAPDELLVVLLEPLQVLSRIAVPGAVRALAFRGDDTAATLFAALDTGHGSAIVRVDLPRPERAAP